MNLEALWEDLLKNLTWWSLLGFIAQACFSARWIWQLVVSHRAKRSVVPPLFWYISLVGALLWICHGLTIRDLPVLLAGLFGLVVYWRNIILLKRPEPREI